MQLLFLLLLLFISAPRLPLTPSLVSISVSQTTANITFSITAIAYTPEQYHIEFIGLELQNALMNSTVIDGVKNTSAINQSYSATLTGLEESNSYNFTIVSTNCLGRTRTQTTTFTTKPAGKHFLLLNFDNIIVYFFAIAPSGMISNCRNITYNSRNVTLTWEPPLKKLQNGKITGYHLMCYEEGPSIPVPGTNGTMDSINAIYIIPIITPFRSYTCSISTINTVGIGPEGFCTFRSGEDS